MKNSGLGISEFSIRLAFILLFSIGMNSFAQTFADSLVSVLKEKNLVETKNFISKSKHWDVHPILFRQILDNYFEYSFEARNSPGYKICFFTNGDKIIYSKLQSGNKKKYEEKDSVEIRQFYKRYAVFFQSKIRIADFFVDDLQYGSGCGFVGVDPPLRKKLSILVAANNTKELTKWLQSPLTEKQLYGVEGFMELQKRGNKSTELQKKLIDFIKNKKGEAKTCNGCIYSNKEISRIFAAKS